MMFKHKSLTLVIVAACFFSAMQLCTEQAFGRYGPGHFEQFKKDLNLSADQQSRLDALAQQFQAEQTKICEQLKQLEDERARPKDKSFYVKYGKQLGVHGDAFTPEEYAKACQAAYFRNQQSILFKQITALAKEKDQKIMSLFTPEQRTKWINFHIDLQDK